NGSCAGGTGAFVDEVAHLIKTPVEEFEACAVRGTHVYDISGRCGVFAKTDIQPLLNQGVSREDIALSTFHAIAKQTIGGLAQGLELKPPIIFEGGPLTFNPTLIRVFAERLGLREDDIIRPDRPEILVAHGTAMSLDGLFADYPSEFLPSQALVALSTYRETVSRGVKDGIKTFFFTQQERENFNRRHALPPKPETNLNPGSVLRVYLGIDAGSTTTKFVLLDEDENVVDSFYTSNDGEPLRVIRKAFIGLRKKYESRGIDLQIIAVGTTGYGELLFAKAFNADHHTVETVSHAAAALKYVPDASFILDIGGQDMKAISITDSIVTGITLNEACSAGCGSFLENFAKSLEIPVSTISEAAFSAKNPAELGSRCTVFMNSCIITEQKNGKSAEDIMAGLCRSIIENIFTKVVRISNFGILGEAIVVQGGTFKNDAVLRSLEQFTGKTVIRAPYPGEMGAVGIALLTKRHVREEKARTGRPFDSGFIGLAAMDYFDYKQESKKVCPFCTNNCVRTLITFSNGTTYVTGNRCERGEIIGDPEDKSIRDQIKKVGKKLSDVPDLMKLRDELLFKSYPYVELSPGKDISIGIPRVLEFYNSMPFWTTFWSSLGFKTVYSAKSSRALFERGLPFVSSDTVCFPAKLAHGHIRSLVDKKVDRIFMPMIIRMPSENTDVLSDHVCAVVKGYPLVLRHSDDPERRWGVPFDTPIFHWFDTRSRNKQIAEFVMKTFGIPERIVRNAISEGDRALDAFRTEMAETGSRVIQE
ncbi:MAG: activase, partial [Chrysiogenales bacterium]